MLNIHIPSTYRSHAARKRDRRQRAARAALAVALLAALAATLYLQVI